MPKKHADLYVITLTGEQSICLQWIIEYILKGKCPKVGDELDREAGQRILKAIRRGIRLK